MAVRFTGAFLLRAAWVVFACSFSVACVERRERFAGDAGTSSAAASARPGPAKLAEIEAACAAICERSRVLRCQNADECLPNCLGAASGTPCNAEFQAFYQCLVPQPIKNWECAEDGVAAIRPGFCEKEQERALSCMQAKAQH
jgi:hypothetical protein